MTSSRICEKSFVARLVHVYMHALCFASASLTWTMSLSATMLPCRSRTLSASRRSIVSNSSLPTPTIMMDIGRREACKDKTDKPSDRQHLRIRSKKPKSLPCFLCFSLKSNSNDGAAVITRPIFVRGLKKKMDTPLKYVTGFLINAEFITSSIK